MEAWVFWGGGYHIYIYICMYIYARDFVGFAFRFFSWGGSGGRGASCGCCVRSREFRGLIRFLGFRFKGFYWFRVQCFGGVELFRGLAFP